MKWVFIEVFYHYHYFYIFPATRSTMSFTMSACEKLSLFRPFRGGGLEVVVVTTPDSSDDGGSFRPAAHILEVIAMEEENDSMGSPSFHDITMNILSFSSVTSLQNGDVISVESPRCRGRIFE